MESKINVTVRIKPLSEAEKVQEKNHLWQQIGENTIMNVRSKEMFSFDSVFGDGTTTQLIFDQQVRELVSTAMQGINVTVFAYGQTSSGKTFTMRGNDRNPGLIPLSITQVFECIQADPERNYEITVSYLETLNDLIDSNNKNLEIRESISKGIYINRLKECTVSTKEEVMKYMFLGDESRIIAETKLNENSSRSHTVFRINIQSKGKNDDLSMRVSQLNLVDLAGSEGASRTQTDGLRLREGSNINRSLLALSNVINRLSQAANGKTFINYRDSKLTRILQPALGGNSKTAIICTITPTILNYQETLNTLHFGQKAKHVKTTVNVNEICSTSISGPEMERAQKEINELRAKLKEYESKVLELQNCSALLSRTEQKDCTSQMIIDTSIDKMNLSTLSTQPNKESDFTVLFLKDQLKFLTDKVKRATLDLEEKERVIQKLEHERREFQRNFESLELENFQMQEKLSTLQNQSNSSFAVPKLVNNFTESYFKTPSVSKQQNKRVLEEDGIQCFDLDENNSIESDLLRMSIGIGQRANGQNQSSLMQQSSNQVQINQGEISEQLKLWQELEKLKRENDGLNNYVSQLEREKTMLITDRENHLALKEELEIIKEEVLMKEEELNKYQRHCHSLSDELKFYKDQNNDLLRRLDDCEKTLTSDIENTSVIIYNESQIETTKLLKDENNVLKGQIQKLKEEIKQLAMEKSRQESVKAELEYNHRASEYNVEILKNQIENLNNEIQIMRKQNEKQKKTIDIIRSTNERLQQDLEHYKKLSLQKSKKANNNNNHNNMNTTANFNQITQALESQRNSLLPQVPIPEPSPLFQVQSTQEIQVNILDQKQIADKDQEIMGLQAEIEERQQKIDELERQVTALNNQQKTPILESEQLKKMRFDNQILMNKLSEYKKAEKGAKEIVGDYEQMKMKYFHVLTENSNQKTQISDLIQSKLDSEILINELNDEKQKYINELYALRMDITRKIDEIAKKNAQIQTLQEEITIIIKRSQDLQQKEKEVQLLQNDIESFLKFFSQVDKHMRTLIKFLRESIQKTNDPRTIEHQQKQIKTIEALLEDLRRAVNSREYSIEASRLIESLFLLSSESLKDVQTSAMLSDKERTAFDTIDNNLMIRTGANNNKRRKITHENEMHQLLKESDTKDFKNAKENFKGQNYQAAQPFTYNLESADEQGTLLRQPDPLMTDKKRTQKSQAKKQQELEGSIRRSSRIKDKVTTESDCC